MSDLGDKLSKAIEKRNGDINSWTWIDKNGDSVRLIDMSVDELQKCYTHALDMLYRNTNYKFGKYVVRENIHKIYNACNAELLHRFIQHELNVDIFKTNRDILDYINRFKEANHLTNNNNITDMFDGIPKEYEELTIGDLVRSCLDTLEPVNRRLISNEFIMSLGVWLTDEDKKDLTEYDSRGKLIPWLQVMRERLFITGGFFKIIPSGLSYQELRSLINLESHTKVSAIPSATLRLLRDKILLMLDQDLEYHIKKWTEIQQRIEEVAKYKGWELVNKYDSKK